MGRQLDGLNRFNPNSLAFVFRVRVGDIVSDVVELLEVEHHPLQAGGLPLVMLPLGFERAEVSFARGLLLELLGRVDLLLQLFDRVGNRLDHSQLVVELGDGVHRMILLVLRILSGLQDVVVGVVHVGVPLLLLLVLGLVGDLICVVFLLVVEK